VLLNPAARSAPVSQKINSVSAAERGLHWDALNDEERELFVDDLLHEEP
jgi:hypothetical protein